MKYTIFGGNLQCLRNTNQVYNPPVMNVLSIPIYFFIPVPQTLPDTSDIHTYCT